MLLLAGCRHAAPLQPPPERLYAALDLPAVGPTPHSGGALSGKVVLVNFFATWCFPCLADLPVLTELQSRHSRDGFTVVMVGLDQERERVLAPFAEQFALPFPVLVADQAMRDGQTPFGGVSVLPTSFLLGRDGRLLMAFAGVAAPEDLSRAIRSALAR
ncbi:MAG: TlpA family protein disulfide reductase [Myxococcales bacterium]|nr:TlpA family protein disulfide reductase [Myxococcales bacterium]